MIFCCSYKTFESFAKVKSRHSRVGWNPENRELIESYRNFLFYPPPPTPPTGGGEEFWIGPIPSPLMGEGEGGGDNNLK
jgi:hypothetical protein